MGVPKRTKTKTRRYTRDIDQIKSDILSPRHLQKYKDTKAAEDLPGLGRHYCVECAKWFETETSLVVHRRGKPHKRRLKQLREEPYTHKEADAAVGLRTDNGRPEKTESEDVTMA
ncbi:putative zinc finger protein [Phaeoacremonium minimum UCRPA7]|uniref:Putative zinc finger protein n=1 Tax=Phaeoacremonium minimum (strain UCR-PA7) TaxID=1286976 RepID=R8BT48_PHAM7|nr:putative zinc finger protein [Phaeoacremonium minimum UCRPA7]EOO02578.1 putative zinc finger protein [Phaeoacremonium minimum UCRPA7]